MEQNKLSKIHLLDDLKAKFTFVENYRYYDKSFKHYEYRILAIKNHKKYIFKGDGFGGLIFDKQATKSVRLNSKSQTIQKIKSKEKSKNNYEMGGI